MRDRPAGLGEGDLRLALAEGWRIDAAALQYAPVGGGMGDQLLTILWTFPRIARASAGGHGAGASRVAAERMRQAILRETEEAL